MCVRVCNFNSDLIVWKAKKATFLALTWHSSFETVNLF